ncbi:MAG: 4-hydroxy-tetrahydrodipicolinate synthase [Clostridiales bacterium]|jgi:4-hydroxy-tetrahydrodipicolinate synthase|nr:4-hydroxy-tetrahydrodipicolinate synthase [Clostridiales bacterium]
MRKPIFKGAATAIITPFAQGAVNREKLGELIDFQIKSGMDALVVCGTTGEASTMPDSEHVATVEFAVRHVGGRVPVIAGAGSNDTEHAVRLSAALEAVGVDGLLSVTPYYNKTSQKGLVAHFGAIAGKVGVPIILYNVPTRTNLNIAPDTLAELSKIENIVGVKECNLEQVGETLSKCEKDFAVYSGEDANILPLMAWGGIGVITTMGNIIPKDTRDICAAFFAGDMETARSLQMRTLRLIKALFCEVNPMPLKEAMNQAGFGVGACRLPLVEVTEPSKKLIREALVAYGLIK